MTRKALIQVQGNRCPGDDGGQFPALAGGGLVFPKNLLRFRWGDVIDMVGPTLLLSSDAGAYITGTVILADGGMICRTFD